MHSNSSQSILSYSLYICVLKDLVAPAVTETTKVKDGERKFAIRDKPAYGVTLTFAG